MRAPSDSTSAGRPLSALTPRPRKKNARRLPAQLSGNARVAAIRRVMAAPGACAPNVERSLTVDCGMSQTLSATGFPRQRSPAAPALPGGRFALSTLSPKYGEILFPAWSRTK